MNQNYRYAGRSLTPRIAQALITEIFSGQTVARNDILREVDRVHRERGGLPSRANYHPGGMALSNMKRGGLAENPSLGRWRILGSNHSTSEPSHLEEETIELNGLSVRSIGSGEGTVYVYYFPTYQLWAESQSESSWPCKIGMTEGDPNLRIHIQVGTGMPESPEIALIIRTDAPAEMERILHDALTLRRRRMEDAPGTEWFLTSPSEVEEIHALLLGGM